MIQGLWDRQVDDIIDINLGDDDPDTYRYEPMIALRARWEKIKKYKYSKIYHDQRKYFFRLFFQRTEC